MCCGPPIPVAGMPLSPATNRVLNNNSPVPSLTPRKRGIAIFPSSASKPKPTLNSSNPFVDNGSSQGVPLALAAGKRKTRNDDKNEPILVGFTSSSQAPAPAPVGPEENGDDEPLDMPPRKSARRVIDLGDQLEGEQHQRPKAPSPSSSGQRNGRVAGELSSTSPFAPYRKMTYAEIFAQAIMRPDDDSYYDVHMKYRDWEDRIEVIQDIEKVNSQVKGLAERYRIVDRLGEGTFSSVYQAIDVHHYHHNNDYWEAKDLNRPPGAPLPPAEYVALKRIYVTSSPERIHNELDIMEDLRGARNVAQLISAFRDEDQVIAVMPYHPNDDFRLFYRLFDPPSMQKYFRCLLRGLGDCHRRGIIHRDVKPANFLYDYASGQGVLVDFGLAERYEPPLRTSCQHTAATYRKPHGTRTSTNATAKVERAVLDARKRESSGRVGFPSQDNRPTAKANRAGTRGFRAPEVLYKCPDQTVAIDIWAVGVILLAVLCQKFPVFQSNDDVEALLELGALFGRIAMEKVAMLHNRTILTNVPSLDTAPRSLTEIVLKLNPKLYEPPCAYPTADDVEAHVVMVDDALDLLKKLLTLDATKRPTAHQALMHPFFNDNCLEHEMEKEDVVHPVAQGECKELHRVTEAGQHIATIDGNEQVMGWGQGRAIGSNPCPYHAQSWKRG